MSQVPKKYNTEGPRYSDHYPAIGEGSYYVKYNYGTVSVDEDGSAYFTAPAGVELYFQALDADGKEIRPHGNHHATHRRRNPGLHRVPRIAERGPAA